MSVLKLKLILIFLFLVPIATAFENINNQITLNYTNSSIVMNDSFGNYFLITTQSNYILNTTIPMNYSCPKSISNATNVDCGDWDAQFPTFSFPKSECNPSLVCSPNTSLSCPICEQNTETELKLVDVLDKKLNPSINETSIQENDLEWSSILLFLVIAGVIILIASKMDIKNIFFKKEHQEPVMHVDNQESLERDRQIDDLKNKIAEMEVEKKKKELDDELMRMEKARTMDELRDAKDKLSHIRKRMDDIEKDENNRMIDVPEDREKQLNKKIDEALGRHR